MILKKGVILYGLKLQMRVVMMLAEEIWIPYKHGFVITSALDNLYEPEITHSSGSLHPFGYALDLRTRDFSLDIKRKVFYSLRKKLRATSEFYDVVWHETHIHTEFDIVKYKKAYEKFKIKCFIDDLKWQRFLN